MKGERRLPNRNRMFMLLGAYVIACDDPKFDWHKWFDEKRFPGAEGLKAQFRGMLTDDEKIELAAMLGEKDVTSYEVRRASARKRVRG